MEIYPITIVPSRYGGVYSEAKWLAWNKYNNDLPSGWNAGDVPCGNFWCDYKEPVGKGNTPDQALEDLERQLEKEKP